MIRLTHVGGPTVLLSHNHHADNLDHCGRALLPTAGRVLTTPADARQSTGSVTGHVAQNLE